MGRDITTLVHSYAHYHLANATMHESAGPLLGLEADPPLDIIFVDFWSPGDSIIEKDWAKKVITYTCCVTSFAAVAFIGGGDQRRGRRHAFNGGILWTLWPPQDDCGRRRGHIHGHVQAVTPITWNPSQTGCLGKPQSHPELTVPPVPQQGR